ncbi:hypothetical protein NP095_08715 [Aeromicrobium duanguangcaii]|uniref:Collagen triple helix repeat-containing protein n=1 Tax=Aeromicrobium duanguangcaii TaxID=2968086 RepID=A0ABY5KA10_9ACTN|nr:hypothetical protein [Aeromicrobium duanguangcaii]UUI67291.1 hypothetical protein NP095_08715 [Aeromicrobium duanguangcaii]
MNKKLKVAAVASAAAMLLVGFSGGGAQAAKWITGSQVKNESLTGADIKNGSLGQKELSAGIQQRLAEVKKLKALKNGVDGKPGTNGADGKDGVDGKDGTDGVDGKDGTDGVDGTNFELTYANTFPQVTIANIGGSFASRATTVGSFELPAGKYLVQTDALFRHNGTTPTAAPSLQAALRVADDSAWGLDAGSIFATLPGATAYEREAQGTSLRVITLTETKTVKVSAFGYNPDGSAAGSGGFAADITVAVQKVG